MSSPSHPSWSCQRNNFKCLVKVMTLFIMVFPVLFLVPDFCLVQDFISNTCSARAAGAEVSPLIKLKTGMDP
jgi:hypothetical protein